MTLLDLVKIFLSYKKWLITLPLCAAALVFVATLNQPQEYISQALIYTGIVPTGDGVSNQARVDVFSVNNQFDNIQTLIISRQVLEETSLHLMARHVARRKFDPPSLEKSIAKFLDEHGEAFKDLPVFLNEEELYKILEAKKQTSPMRWLIEDDASMYSDNQIKKGLKVKRSGSSDMLEIVYTSNEASSAKETLNFLIDAFSRRFKGLRETEAGSMVQFFEKEVAKASERLTRVADEMKLFQMQNRIINYNEQTHLVAIESEHLNGQYYDELMKLAASERAYQDLRSKLGDPFQQVLSSESIVKSQEGISAMMTKKQLLNASSEEYKNLSESIQKEETSLRKAINQLYVEGRSEDGVSKKDILKQWLDQFIALSEARARVIVMEQRRESQKKEYDFFAPLGSVLHNYERQMDVYEKEYLDLLHSVNQARLRQQSVETTTMLATVDAPSQPLKPEASKRKLLIIIGWLGSFLMIMGVILFLEYFDSTLQSPERAESKTGLAVIGATTADPETPIGKMSWANTMLRFFANISRGAGGGRKVLVVSMAGAEQGLATALHLARLLTQQGDKVVLAGQVVPGETGFPILDSSDPSKDHDTILGIAPSIASVSADLNLLHHVTDTVIVVSSGHTWTSADRQSVELLEKITHRKPFLHLIGVEEEKLEGWLGELPKKRSKLRIIIKKLVQFQFH